MLIDSLNYIKTDTNFEMPVLTLMKHRRLDDFL